MNNTDLLIFLVAIVVGAVSMMFGWRVWLVTCICFVAAVALIGAI